MLTKEEALKEKVRQELALEYARTDEEFMKATTDIFFAPPEVAYPYIRAITGDKYFEKHFIKKDNNGGRSSPPNLK